jgi:hypothetical protein
MKLSVTRCPSAQNGREISVSVLTADVSFVAALSCEILSFADDPAVKIQEMHRVIPMFQFPATSGK